MSRAKYVHFLVCKLPNQISTLDSLHNSRLHFYFKIYSLKDISNFRYSNKQIITFSTSTTLFSRGYITGTFSLYIISGREQVLVDI
jgi:hypothetical protein